MSEPRIVIVIPTRERADVLEYALKTVTSQSYERLEIIVCDNASSDRTSEVVRAANDPRVRHVVAPRRLSMTENWELAFSHVVGDAWVGVIGDDDGLVPDAVQTVGAWARETDLLALRGRVAYYTWPSAAPPRGRLIVPLQDGVEVRDARVALADTIAGLRPYQDLPMLYTGSFVHSSVIETLRRRGDGRLFRSSFPDIYTAIAIASVVPRFGFSHAPLAISGSSKHSTGRAFLAGGGAALTTFVAEGKQLHPAIPSGPNGMLPPSIQALVYESVLQSAFLRSGPEPTHAEQLEIILAVATDPNLPSWARAFADRHGLDLAHIQARAVRRRAVLRGRRGLYRLREALRRDVIETPPAGANDVFAISRVVAEVRRDKPGTMAIVGGNIARLARRGFSRLRY
jgi:hypothetical protein